MGRAATRSESPTATAALLVPRRPGSRWYSYGIVLVVKVLLVLPMVQFSILAWRRIAVFPRADAAAAILAIGAAALCLRSRCLPPDRPRLRRRPRRVPPPLHRSHRVRP